MEVVCTCVPEAPSTHNKCSAHGRTGAQCTRRGSLRCVSCRANVCREHVARVDGAIVCVDEQLRTIAEDATKPAEDRETAKWLLAQLAAQ